MKATGMVRKPDNIGRLVLPVEIRRSLRIRPGDGLAVSVHNDLIILNKHEPGCIFCGNTQKTVSYGDKKVCRNCVSVLAAKVQAR